MRVYHCMVLCKYWWGQINGDIIMAQNRVLIKVLRVDDGG